MATHHLLGLSSVGYERDSDKVEVPSSILGAPTNGCHLPPLNGRVIEKVTIKVRQALPTFYIGV